MHEFLTKSPFLPIIALLALASCAMPKQPDGADKEGMTHIADQMLAAGDDAGAADFYVRALQRKPNDLAAHLGLASILEAHGNYEMAETHYAEAMKLVPKDRDITLAEGRTLIRLGRAADARDLYLQLLKRDAHDVKALN